MNSIKNIELLPKFFNEVKSMCGEAKLSDGRLIVALMSDLLPEADELKRCIKMVYESGAITHILEISKDSSNLQLYKNKALDRVINYSFMDKQIATSVIDAVVAAVYPEIKSSSSADEQHLLGNNCFAKQDYVQSKIMPRLKTIWVSVIRTALALTKITTKHFIGTANQQNKALQWLNVILEAVMKMETEPLRI